MKNFIKIKSHWRLLLVVAAFVIVAIVFFNILWGDPNLAVAIVAFGTLLLALVTAMSIDNSRGQEKRDRKERLLNEIIEWAEDIRKSSSESIDPSKIVYDTAIEQEATQRGFRLLRGRYQELNTKSAYMEKAISKVFEANLLSAVEKVIQKLDETIEMLGRCLTRKANENSEKVEEYKKLLDGCAEDLIKEATEIKTRDIG